MKRKSKLKTREMLLVTNKLQSKTDGKNLKSGWLQEQNDDSNNNKAVLA